MRNLKLNKKAADKIISVYWFAILFIVAAAIVYMVLSFYGKPYDVRELEANILANKVANCISNAGYLNTEVFSETFKNDFSGQCELNFQTEDAYDWKEREQYYVDFEILSFSSKQSLSKSFAGNPSLKEFCGLNDDNFPFCLQRSFYAIDENNAQYQINVFSIVRKTEKNTQ